MGAACMVVSAILAWSFRAHMVLAGEVATFAGPKGTVVQGVRCGTPSPSAEEVARVQDTLRPGVRQRMLEAGETVVIPVAFHVVRRDDGSADITEQMILDQMDVLNAAYLTSGFQFTLESVDRTDNTAWSTHTPGTAAENNMKQALAVDPEVLVVKHGSKEKANEIDGISGATISCKAVAKILNSGNSQWLDRLPEQGKEPALQVPSKEEREH